MSNRFEQQDQQRRNRAPVDAVLEVELAGVVPPDHLQEAPQGLHILLNGILFSPLRGASESGAVDATHHGAGRDHEEYG